ncbi:MAG: hypothetical protein WD824_26820 [Cyclobacteriaceae bacterium]
MKRILIILIFLGKVTLALPQDDIAGSGRALRFDGIGDFIDLGKIYDDVALPVTMSVWIYLDPTTQTQTFPIIDSQENSLAYNGFTFVVSTISHIAVTYGDGRGGNNPVYRRSKIVYINALSPREPALKISRDPLLYCADITI